MHPFLVSFTVGKESEGTLLRDFLLLEKHVSRSLLTDIKFNGGKLLVNGRAVTVRAVLKHGDVVTVVFPEERGSASMKPYPFPLSICYEDEHVLVVNKPPRLATIPSRREPDASLAQAVLHHYEAINLPSVVHIVTRLDRDTSGLVLIAKHRFCHSLMAKQQQKNMVNRTYMAVVHGKIEEDAGTIDKPIARKKGSIIEREVNPDGQHAVTHFQVIRRFSDKTLVSVRLETGRTHQIRVHFSALGFPLVGDDLYGGKTDQIDRQALHSAQLSFFHPFLQKRLTFQEPLPDDMRSILK